MDRMFGYFLHHLSTQDLLFINFLFNSPIKDVMVDSLEVSIINTAE